MNDLVTVDFYDDQIEAARKGDRIQIILRRCCENLGLAMESQLRKLKSKPWATVTEMIMVAEDGKQRALAVIDLETLPMWLASIDIRKVKPELRDKLARYQREAARVLADHFFGKKTAPVALMTSESLARCIDACRGVLSLGGMEPRDELLLKDFARNGMLMVTGKHMLSPNTQGVVISNRCAELGYQATRGNEPAIGKCIAKRYRAKHDGENPPKRAQNVDGAPRSVNHYTLDDLDVVDAGIREFFGREGEK